jgi:peptidoglycan-associated lipoprotein
MNSISRLTSIACMAALLAAFGCASTTQPPDAAATTTPSTPGYETTGKAELALQGAGAPKLAPVYFDIDRATLREEAREALKHQAHVILQHPEWGVVTIEGHCDERGSEEYNLALGDQRAGAVARYLSDLGVPASRLTTRTYGEARPAVAGHDEAAWQRNRRTEFLSKAQDSASARR